MIETVAGYTGILSDISDSKYGKSSQTSNAIIDKEWSHTSTSTCCGNTLNDSKFEGSELGDNKGSTDHVLDSTDSACNTAKYKATDNIGQVGANTKLKTL